MGCIWNSIVITLWNNNLLYTEPNESLVKPAFFFQAFVTFFFEQGKTQLQKNIKCKYPKDSQPRIEQEAKPVFEKLARNSTVFTFNLIH